VDNFPDPGESIEANNSFIKNGGKVSFIGYFIKSGSKLSSSS